MRELIKNLIRLFSSVSTYSLEKTDEILIFKKENGADKELFKVTLDDLGDLIGIKLLKIHLSYSNWQPCALNEKNIIIGQLPAGAIPIITKLKCSESFIGGSITSEVASVQVNPNDIIHDQNGSIQLISVNDLIAEPTQINGYIQPFSYNTIIPNQELPTDISMDLFVDGVGPIIDELTQGELDIWIWYVIGI